MMAKSTKRKSVPQKATRARKKKGTAKVEPGASGRGRQGDHEGVERAKRKSVPQKPTRARKKKGSGSSHGREGDRGGAKRTSRGHGGGGSSGGREGGHIG
jgi:hypothetical protein